MGVILQPFYWDSPKLENREHQWWAYIKSKLPTIAQAGFTALWLRDSQFLSLLFRFGARGLTELLREKHVSPEFAATGGLLGLLLGRGPENVSQLSLANLITLS
jgi:hypothetical protein